MPRLRIVAMKITNSTSWRRLAFRLYRFAIGLALRSLLAGKFTLGAKLLIASVGYWRFWPNGIILHRLGPQHRDVLDVSSPKILSLFLSQDDFRSVVATDLDDPSLFTRWVRYAELMARQNYRVEFQDAQSLHYPDASFDFVYSISVIEHIPGNGDTEALRQFARVLRPGGIAVIEVPYRRQREEIVMHYDSKGAALASPRFYERHYDRALLDERLKIPELEVTAQWILGERWHIDRWIATNRLPRLIRLAVLPIEPFLAAVNYWIRTDDTQGNPLAAMIIYRKPE